VDNNRLGAGLAMEYGFDAWGTKMKVGGQVNSFRMLERRTTKILTPTSADGKNHTPQLVTDEVPDDSVHGNAAVPGREGLQTNNPGWPGFLSAGWMTSAGLYRSVAL
jgi:long-chain fatty acid transport protein